MERDFPASEFWGEVERESPKKVSYCFSFPLFVLDRVGFYDTPLGARGIEVSPSRSLSLSLSLSLRYYPACGCVS